MLMLHAAWQPELWCYPWSCSKWYTGESALSTSDTFGEVSTVCGVWRVCQGGTCPNCSPEHLARFSGSVSCGRILQVNGAFRLSHSVVSPSGFLQAMCQWPVSSWGAPGFTVPFTGRVDQSAFPIRLQEEWCLEESWVLWKVFMCSQLLWDQYS